MNNDNIKQYAKIFFEELNNSDSTVVLTGAGVSTDSGIPDFRSPSGLYSKISQRTFEIDFFFNYPEKYYEIARQHIHTLSDRLANPTHEMLARLEQLGFIKAVITQNIDSLHQKAGSKNVIEFHGNVNTFTCTNCQKSYDKAAVNLKLDENQIPLCDCGYLIRPNIVFFGDPIPIQAIEKSYQLAQNAKLFIAMGSSLTVNPAAALPSLALQHNSRLIIINKGTTKLDSLADHRFEVPLKDFSTAVMELL